MSVEYACQMSCYKIGFSATQVLRGAINLFTMYTFEPTPGPLPSPALPDDSRTKSGNKMVAD